MPYCSFPKLNRKGNSIFLTIMSCDILAECPENEMHTSVLPCFDSLPFKVRVDSRQGVVLQPGGFGECLTTHRKNHNIKNVTQGLGRSFTNTVTNRRFP